MTSPVGRSAGRRASNLTNATRESSVQPERPRSFGADFRKPGLLHPPLSVATLPQPAPFGTRHQTSAHSFRVRLAGQRASRAATTASPSPVEASGFAAKNSRASRNEELIFKLIFAVALAGVVWRLVSSAPLANGLQSFVMLVRQWAG